MSVAARRKTQQRQRAEKRAELGNRTSFEEHQGPGRRAQRLGGGGHRIPLHDPLVKAANQSFFGKRGSHTVVLQCNNPSRARALIPTFKRVWANGTMVIDTLNERSDLKVTTNEAGIRRCRA